ncbi:uncharacterized protein MELLADRAFT_105293 [Melampsora larici-populina 98AG31]|uniref:Uncharacterized protein n=1 Tax=Melampsora larici-populina (strain 98AG31 / pathotype 3-4-7) TaxID=747676 RepID=F4RHM5_MELLP|nr:uncharacterized protein MELLADRAFT_105293 [Melampsora larici-populina 98AG31]EGG07852.1 hypothetical protein MELLADRAFT_105293 [Melampsora larici-populina 98AG31]
MSWGIPMEHFDPIHLFWNMQDSIQTADKDSNPGTIPVLQHTSSNHPDRLSMISPQHWSHENDQMYHTTSTITPFQNFEGSTTNEFHGTRSLPGSLYTDTFGNYCNHNDLPLVSLEDPSNQNLNNAVQTDFSDTEWLDHWIQDLPTPKLSNTLDPEPELPINHSSNSNSRKDAQLYGPLVPEDLHQFATELPQSSIYSSHWVHNLIHDGVDAGNMYAHKSRPTHTGPSNYPSNPSFSSTHTSEVGDYNNILGIKSGQQENSVLSENQRRDDKINLPYMAFQSTYPKNNFEHLISTHDENQYLLTSEWESHPLGHDQIQGDHILTPSIQGNNIKSTQVVFEDNPSPSSFLALEGAVSGKDLNSPDSNDIGPPGKKKNSNVKKRKQPIAKDATIGRYPRTQNQKITSISGVSNGGIYKNAQDSIANGVTDHLLFERLMKLIRIFDESYHPTYLTFEGHLFLPELSQEMEKHPEKGELWHKIGQAQKALNINFINLLLILQPEASTQKGSKAKLIQDGVSFLTEMIYQWVSVKVENDSKHWKKSPHMCYDISEPSSLLQYASKLMESKSPSLTILWKLWKRWFRYSAYPMKNVAVGIKEFASLLRDNLLELKPRNGSDGSKPLFENYHLHPHNPLHLDNSKYRLPGKSSRGGPYRWRDYYHLTVRLGRYQYEMLTLRVEADTHFDQLNESLKKKCLSENQGDTRSLGRVDGFVRKLYKEFTPCFFGSLLALKLEHNSSISIEDLIDDGWKFLANFLNLLARSCYTKKAKIEEADPMAQMAMSHILPFSQRDNHTGNLSLGAVFSLLVAWFNQSSLPNKQMVWNSTDFYALIKIMHSKNEFPVLAIK